LSCDTVVANEPQDHTIFIFEHEYYSDGSL